MRALAVILLGGIAAASTVNINNTDIQAAVSASPPYTTFQLAAGTYRIPAPLTLKTGDTLTGPACAPPATPCKAQIYGSRLLTFKKTGAYWTASAPGVRGEVYSNPVCLSDYPACVYPEDLFMDWRPLHRVLSVAEVKAGKWYLDYGSGTVYMADSPTGHVLELSTVPSAVIGNGATGVTLRYIEFAEFASPITHGGVYPREGGGNNWTMDHCTVWGVHSAGISAGVGMIIADSHIHDNGQMGIALGQVEHIAIQGNTIIHNNYAGVDPGFGAGGIKAGSASAVEIRGNDIEYNEGDGIHFDVGSGSCIVAGNNVSNNYDYDGIDYEISYGPCLIYDNVVANNGRPGIHPHSPNYQIDSVTSQKVEAFCNTLTVGQGENGWRVGASNRGNDANGRKYISAGNSFHHNTVVWQSNGVAGYYTSDPSQTAFFSGNTAPDYNVYVGGGSTAHYTYGSSNPLLAFPQFQAAGADRHGTVTEQMPAYNSTCAAIGAVQ